MCSASSPFRICRESQETKAGQDVNVPVGWGDCFFLGGGGNWVPHHLLKGLFKSLLSKIGSSFWKRKERSEDPTPMPLLAEFFVPGSTPLIGVELKLLLSCLWNWNCSLRSRFLPSREFCKWKKLIVKSHSFWNIFSPVLLFPALLIDTALD